ncbi:hypothetical protein ACFVAV_11350 [Nocardia sp. NPDC057663]|uniref:hypothetical protein n=1 Tax=Nocardia sp. NPDC057663 TaxID=3346201 RepID=UPI00367207AF
MASNGSALVDALEHVVVDYIRMNADIVDRNRYGDPEWSYRSAYHLLLDHGRFFTPTARPSDVSKLPDRFCYQNAVTTAYAYGDHGLLYAEGFACSRAAAGIPIQHAWCVLPDGTVVDPTWEPTADVYFGVAVTDPALWPSDGGGLLSDFERCLPLLRDRLPADMLGSVGRKHS